MSRFIGNYSKNFKYKHHPKEEVFTSDVSEYNATYDILKGIFKLIGVRLTRNDSRFARWCWNTYFWFDYLSLALGFVLETVDVILETREGSLLDLFKMMPCMGYLILALTKSYKIVYHRPVFENLVQELRTMWPQGVVSREEHATLTKGLRKMRIITTGYYWCNLALSVAFNGLPLIEILKRLAGKDVPLILAFLFWLPFDPFKPEYYPFVYLVQCWLCLLSVLFMMSGDLLFGVFINHITIQFELLALRITKLFHVPVDRQIVHSYPLGVQSAGRVNVDPHVDMTDDDTWEVQHKAQLRDVIIRHTALIRLSGDVEDLFAFSLLINFLNSSIIICVCGYCCIMVEKWNEICYKFFLMTALSQIWILSYYGQELINSSSGVSQALYDSEWYRASKNIKHIIHIMIHRSQKEVHVTTFGFSIICLLTYCTIIQTSWSYLMLLLNVLG